MNCPGCGHENRDAARFCEECGHRFLLTCGSCGTDLRAGAKFCDGCGASTATAAPSPEAGPERAPRDYTPKHLADKILQSKSAVEGERKQVTVLFADVTGSMELAEQSDPEEWHAILDRFFQILADGVHRFEGTVNQYTGDGIMALFGAPIAHEDHAARACYAALQLREELGSYAREVKRDRGLAFSVRMGINSGDVVVGKIGDDLRMDYTAQGHTVGLAARMQALASPDTVYLTGNTASLVAGYFALEDLGPFSVKGVRAAVPVHQLLGIGSLRTRMDVSRARGLTRFVGRDEDLQTLDRVLERCLQGNGSVVGLVADAGVGKSRLCYEFLEKCRTRGLRTLEGQAVAHGRNIPFLPILQIFRAYFGIGDRDSDREAREKIAGRLLLLDDAFRNALPLLFDFLGVPDPDRPAPGLDPESRQRQLFGVLRKVVTTSRKEDPIITLIEDLHWLDAGSEGWVAEMIDAVGGTPGLLVLNFRPEYHADWMGKSYYRQLPLAPLGADAIRELLRDLLGTDPSVEGLAERIHARTSGNPFFTEEVIQSLIENGTLEGTRGRYRLVTPVDDLEIPATVQSILAARIDRLLEQAKQVLQTAAVIGKEFQGSILESVIELPHTDLMAALELLKGNEFIYEQSLYPVAEYAFKHPLTQEVALQSQLRERRREIHAAVARAIEAAHAGKLDEQAALLAHHWQEAAEPVIAARWHRRAAERAGVTHAREMLRHLRAVWELLRGVPETEETFAAQVDAVSEILTQGIRLGLSDAELAPIVAAAEELEPRATDAHARIRLLRGRGTYVAYSGRFLEGRALLDRALSLADEVGASELAVGTRMFQFVTYLSTGPIPDALAVIDDGLERLRAVGELGSHPMGYDSEAMLRGFRSFALTFGGRVPEARAEIESALERARTLDDTGAMSWVLGLQCRVEVHAGDPVAAQSAGARGLELAEGLGTPNLLGTSGMFLGQAFALAGDFARADELIEISSKGSRSMPMMKFMAAAAHAHVMIETREAGEACEAAETAVRLARESDATIAECDALVALARARVRSRGADARGEVEAALERAATRAREAGYRFLEPSICMVRSELARACGDGESAERELREAQRLFGDMGATGWVARLESELG